MRLSAGFNAIPTTPLTAAGVSPMAGALQQAPLYFSELQKMAQQQAATPYAGQLAQGQAQTAMGIGQQEMVGGQYASAQNEAEIQNIMSQAGVNRAQAQQLLQLKALAPNEYRLELAKLVAAHPIKSAALTKGKGWSDLVTGMQNVPTVNADGSISYSQGQPSQYGLGNGSGSQQPTQPAQTSQAAQPASTPFGLGAGSAQIVMPPKNSKFTQNEIYHLNSSGLTPEQQKSVYAGNRQLAPDGYIYYNDNGKLARTKREG